jgi:meso-butanediol dehydrogenase / (S,S)-butanediol dehydrogenase / diacetyl reductase
MEGVLGRLSNRTALVSGAGRGIGRAIADALVREGANVVYADIDPGITKVAEGAKERIGSTESGKAIGAKLDVTDRGQTRAAIELAVQSFGALNIMFNNAGINKPMNFLDVDEENWNSIVRVNGFGVLVGMQEAAKQMIKQGAGGKIINTASIAGRQGYDNIAPYCASKFAVVSLTQSAARALASHNITVNAFAPGVVNTPLWEQLDKDLMALGVSSAPGQAIAEFSAGILRGRAASPADITGTTTFLASADSDYMTGQVVMIDGGMVLV